MKPMDRMRQNSDAFYRLVEYYDSPSISYGEDGITIPPSELARFVRWAVQHPKDAEALAEELEEIE